jgi:hypothetical protein
MTRRPRGRSRAISEMWDNLNKCGKRFDSTLRESTAFGTKLPRAVFDGPLIPSPKKGKSPGRVCGPPAEAQTSLRH